MPPLGPIKRGDLLRHLGQLGFSDPLYSGGHAYMKGRGRKVRIPNPHRGDISEDLLRRILRQANIGREEWEKL